MDCSSGNHDWGPTGLWVQGVVYMFCQRKDCRAEARQVWQVMEGPGMSIDGMALDIEDDPQGAVAKTVCREAQGTYGDLDLKPGDVVVDIGAHVGVISIYLAKRYSGIRVLAYEPCKASYDRMLRNIAANKAEGIMAFNEAVTSDGRTVQLSGDAAVNSGGMQIYGERGVVQNSVLSVTLDSIIYGWEFDMGSVLPHDHHSGLPPLLPHGGESLIASVLPLPTKVPVIDRIALLKIDCEGAEYEILTADENLLDRVTYLRGEFHASEERGWDPEQLLEVCRRHIKLENIQVNACRI